MAKLRDDWGFNIPFKDALATIRHNLGMTMQELANSSGVSQSYISQLETGVRTPSDKTIKKLAYALSHILVEDKKLGNEENVSNFNNEDEAKKFNNDIYKNLKAAKYFSENKLDERIDYSEALSFLSYSIIENKNIRKNDLEAIEAFLNLPESERDLVIRIIRSFNQ